MSLSELTYNPGPLSASVAASYSYHLSLQSEEEGRINSSETYMDYEIKFHILSSRERYSDQEFSTLLNKFIIFAVHDRDDLDLTKINREINNLYAEVKSFWIKIQSPHREKYDILFS